MNKKQIEKEIDNFYDKLFFVFFISNAFLIAVVFPLIYSNEWVISDELFFFADIGFSLLFSIGITLLVYLFRPFRIKYLENKLEDNEANRNGRK